MQQDTAAKTNLGIEGIVRKYLLIDPADLISLDPEKAFVAAGLHEFWRRTIKRALGLLCAPGDIRLCGSEASAKALGWPMQSCSTFRLSWLGRLSASLALNAACRK